MLRPGVWPVLVSLLAVAAVASAGPAYAHPNPPDSLTDPDADHPGHVFLDTNNRENQAVFRAAMHENGTFGYAGTNFENERKEHTNGRGTFGWPPESGRYVNISFADSGQWTDTAAGGLNIKSGRDVILHIDFYGPDFITGRTKTYNAVARIDSTAHDSVAATVEFKENATYVVVIDERSLIRAGESLRKQEFTVNSTGLGHTERYIGSGMEPGRHFDIVVHRQGDSYDYLDIYAKGKLGESRTDPVVAVNNITAGESGASIDFTGGVNGSIAMRLRDIDTGRIVNSSVIGNIQNGSEHTVSNFALLRPDTVHRYDFAREADRNFDDRDSVSGFFRTAPRTSTPLTLGESELQTVDEGAMLNYPIPRNNPENYSITWSIVSGQTGDAAVDGAGRLTWMPGEEHGRDMPYEFVIRAAGYIDDVTTVLAVLVNETNEPPVLHNRPDHDAVVGIPFDLEINATDPDIPAQTISYRIVSQDPPGNPAVINGTTGEMTWTARTHGTQLVTVRADDGFDPPGTADITLNITVPNTAPTAASFGVEAAPSETIVMDLAGRNHIADAEQDAATLVVAVNGIPAQTQGNARAAGSTITYAAGYDARGSDTISYTVTDDAGLSDTGTITVTIRPPVLPGDDRTVIVPISDATVGSILGAYMPRGLVTLAGIPAPDIAAALDATYGNATGGFLLAGILADGAYADLSGAGIAGGGNTTVFLREIGNVPPILPGIGSYSTNAQETLEFRVSVTDFDDTVSYRLSDAPADATISGQGDFRWTPGPADVGNYTFAITAYDGHNATDTGPVTVRVFPAGTPSQSPTAPDVAATVSPGGRILIIPAVSDPDGDPAVLISVTDTAEGAIALSGNSIEYAAGANPGTETVIYSVTDGRGGFAMGTITITIQ